MPTYAVGDIQGCFDALQTLLAKATFDPTKDTLWVAGDLVNRGPNNVDVLRFIKNLGAGAKVVLGNHDLHLLAVHAGKKSLGKKDTLSDVLNAPDCQQLISWLRHQPLMHRQGNWVMSHAGIPHIWSVAQAFDYAGEVGHALKGQEYLSYLAHMYGNQPAGWSENLQGTDRLRVITNYLTRMRFINRHGELELKCKADISAATSDMTPWFSHNRPAEDADKRFLFGHWAALEGQTGQQNFIGLDTGCVWGGCLSMLRLEDNTLFKTECPAG